VLTIFNADDELRRKALPYVSGAGIDWEKIFENDFGRGIVLQSYVPGACGATLHPKDRAQSRGLFR
jgi:hypothetical protein